MQKIFTVYLVCILIFPRLPIYAIGNMIFDPKPFAMGLYRQIISVMSRLIASIVY